MPNVRDTTKRYRKPLSVSYVGHLMAGSKLVCVYLSYVNSFIYLQLSKCTLLSLYV